MGKVLGGGMPVAAVAGRREVLELSTRASGRVKFEGGTYSAHELSLIAAREVIRYLVENEDTVYPRLASKGDRMRQELETLAGEAGLPVHVLGPSTGDAAAGSLVFVHPVREGARRPACPEDLVQDAHPLITERLLKSVLLLEELSTRSGLGALSLAHDDRYMDRTIDGYRAALARMKRAGLF